MALPPSRRRPRRPFVAGLLLLALLAVLLVAARNLIASRAVHHLSQLGRDLVTGGFLLAAALLAVLTTRLLVAGAFSRAAGTAAATWRTAVSWAVYVLLALVIVAQLRIDLSGLLLGSAVLGVVVGVAAQTSLGNLFAGVALLVARPIAVGRWVHLRTYLFGGFGGSDFSGTVVHIGSFYTVLSVGGRLVYVPNSAMLLSSITTGPIPVQLDLDVTLPASAPLSAIERRIAAGLELQPPASVALRPQRVSLCGDAEVSCRLLVAALRAVDAGRVVRLLAEAAAELAPAARPAAGGGPSGARP